MKLKFLALFAVIWLVGASLFAANVKVTNTAYGLVSTGANADVFVAIVTDTVVKTATTASDTASNLLVSSIDVDWSKYIGYEVIWQILDASDSVVVNDTCFPVLWTSIDNTNWTSITATTGITGDTLTGASVAAAKALVAYNRRLRFSDASPAPVVGRYLRPGVRYAGMNEDAARRYCKWKLTVIALKKN